MGTKLLFVGLLVAMLPMDGGTPGVIQWTGTEAKWQPGPNGSSLWVLEGNPKSTGMFSVRLKLGPDFKLPLHTHPKEERVTVLSGQVWLDWGEKASRANAKRMAEGAFYVTPAGMPHALWSDEGAVLQLTGQGPWEVNLISAK